jgi:hypothetical protein
MRRLLLAAAFLLLTTIGPVWAWSEPECARFDRGQPLCAVTEWYNLQGQAGTLKILLADGEPFLLLQHEVLRTPRSIVPVLAHVDDQPPVQREARTQEDGVLIPLLAGDLEALARGQSVTVALPQAAITYPLTGSFAALNALLARYAAFATGDAQGTPTGEVRG